MTDLLSAWSGMLFVFWAALALDLKRWWPADLRLAGRAAGGSPPEADEVLIVIPARNEAEALPDTLPALLAQGEDFSALVLVDDGSTDGTREMALRLAAASPWAGKVRVVTGTPTPSGWSGKLHALETGLQAAAGRPPAGSRWILFTDADIRHSPHSLRRLLAKAAEGPYDLVSVMVRLRCESRWERLLIPPFLYFFQLLYPFRRVADPRSRAAAAAGGCLLVRKSSLQGMGGLQAIRGAVIDDVALAARVKRDGGRTWLGTDPGMVSVRAYGRFGEIARMVSRTAFTQLGHSPLLLLATLLLLGALFVAPPLLAAACAALGAGVPALLALGAWLIQAATLLPVVRHQRVHGAYALTLPLASLLYAWMTFRSAWLFYRASGVEWKGRPVG